MNLKCNFCIDKNKIIEGIIHFFFLYYFIKRSFIVRGSHFLTFSLMPPDPVKNHMGRL